MINNTLPPVNHIFDNLPYYLSYIEWYRTQGGNYAIRIYIKPGDFPTTENEKELSFIQHRLRYYTLRLLVSKLKYAIRREIPEFPIF